MARKPNSEIQLVVQELTSLVQNGEILKFTEKDLENKFDMTRKTLRGHLTKIKAEIGSRDIKIVSLRLANILDEIMDDIEVYWRKAKKEKDEKRVMYYTKQIFFAIEKFTDFLERFGIKEKVADRVQVDANVVSSINVNITTFDNERIKDVDAMEVVDYERIANDS